MPESAAAAKRPPSPHDLPCPLPPPAAGEPPELGAFRRNPASDDAFLKLRRSLREAENWPALASLLVLHAAAISGPPKVSELCVQAYELWNDRVKDKQQAAHALVRALQAEPHNARVFELLRKVYESLGAHDELATLLRFRIEHLRRSDRAAVPAALVELGRLSEQRCEVAEAIACYQQALELNPGERQASEQLIRLHLQAGAWLRAIDLINAELARIDPAKERQRFAGLHLRLARIEAEQLDNIPSAAIHLQTALKSNPDDVAALRAFGALYLGSGKASEEGLTKAADVFFRAAKLARAQGDEREALKLLRRALSLRPDHHEAGNAMAELLMAQERWMELDELYAAWIGYVTEADSYGLWLSRGELLDVRLARKEEARACYEQATRIERPGGEAWQRLEALLVEQGDHHGLVGLYERWSELAPDTLPTAKLLHAARVARDELGDEERAAVCFYRVLEREPFNAQAFEGYKEHWRRKNNWSHLAGLILYQVDQAMQIKGPQSPIARPEFGEHFVELAEIYERRLGDLAGALDAWNRFAQAYPGDWRPREQIARIDKRARMLDATLAAAESELARTADGPRRFEVLRRLTSAHRERMIDPQRAIFLYQEMLALAPGDAGALRALSEMYERTGAYDQVIELLRRQHDVTRSISQRVVLLRRMAELWQYELHSPREALWACEQILGYSPSDIDALHRMQGLCAELGDAPGEYEALSRELQLVGEPAQRLRILRRMADVADRKLQDAQRSAQTWSQLLAADPHNLEVIDKLIAAYEALGRHEELAGLLGKAASSARTPPIRQLDYLMRLGHLAETALGDGDLACSAFERALRIHRDHRGAVESLTRLYRNLGSWHGLAAALGNLQELADSDEEALQIGWERAEVLADRLDNAAAAIRVLEQLAQGGAIGNRDVALKLLDLYEHAAQYDKLIRHAETLLLSALEVDERRELFAKIAESHMRLREPARAIAAFGRFMAEYEGDAEGLRILGELQSLAGDHQATLETLGRRLETLTDPAQQVVTLEQMAEVCETGLGHAKRALALLGRALGIAPGSRDLKQKIEAFAERHKMYKDLLVVYGERFTEMSQRADSRGQIDLCLGASSTAEKKIGDPDLAFAWARKAYFVALRAGVDATAVADRLQGLARAHALWTQMLDVHEQELGLQEKTAGYGDFATITLLLSAAEIARERLGDPARALAFLQRAYKLRAEDEDLARQIESIAEQHGMWSALVELHETRLSRARTGLGRFDACAAIAKICERQLGAPDKAFAWLRRAWDDLRGAGENSLAEEAADLMIQLAERHQLWPQLADHHRQLAHSRFQRAERGGLQSLKDAARIEYERLGDALAALRTLRAGVAHDRDGAALLPAIEAMAAKVDEKRTPDAPPLGALTLLAVTQQIVGQTVDPAIKLQLLKRRAELRDKQLGDAAGAIAEWLRAQSLHPGSEEARFELERLAERENLWHLLLLTPASELSQETGKAQQGKLLGQIADLYESCLGRPEYALRARIAAWKLHPDLPPETGDLGPAHGRLWRLAGLTGAYVTPPPPRDPLLWPQIAPPELADLGQWKRLGLHPDTLAPPVAPAAPARRDETSVVDIADLEEVPRPTREIFLSELEPFEESMVGRPTREIFLSEIEPLDESGTLARREHTSIVDIADLEPVEPSIAARPPRREHTNVVDIADLEPLEPSVQTRAPRREPSELFDLDELETIVPAARARRENTNIVDLDELIVETMVPAGRPRRENTSVVDPDELIEEPSEVLDLEEQTGGRRTLPRPAKRPPPAGRPAPPRPPGRLSAGTAESRRPPAARKPPAAPEPVPQDSPPPPVASRAAIAAATAGLPPLPELTSPVLPPRPRVHSAWEELALAYAGAPAGSKTERAGLARVLARVWDEGARQPDLALARYEEALALVPDDPAALAGLTRLADQAEDPERLIAALSRLLGELTLPEHIVAYHLRLADLYEQTGKPERAEEQYKGVLAVAPRHLPALRNLAALYERVGRDREAAELSARLYDAEVGELTLAQKVGRGLQLARDLAFRADRGLEAIRRLEALLREDDTNPDIYDELIELLQREGLWTRAVEVLRKAAETVADPGARVRCLARAAALHEERLAQPDAAVATWQEVLQLQPDDPDALARLQSLYLATENYGELLPILDRRLAQVAHGDRDARIALLVVKARALQEGLGDEAAAVATLETLAGEAPENDDVALGLSRLYRKSGRLAEGLELLRRRLAELSGTAVGTWIEGQEPLDLSEVDPETLSLRRLRFAEALADALAEEAGDPQGALAVLDEALAEVPPEIGAALQTRRIELSRATGDDQALVRSLAGLGEPDGLLEAAALARDRLGDAELAAQLYTRVLAEIAPGAPQRSRRLSAAIEGLVGLRLAAGDLDGADALLDAQLASIEDPEIRARILTESGRALLRGGQDLALARRRFEGALQADPDHAPARLALGEALLAAGLHAEAEPALEAAVEAFGLTRDQPRLVEGLLLLARLFEQTERAAEAYRRLSMALRHVPDDLEIRAAMAKNRAAAGRMKDAVAALEPVEQRLAAGEPVAPERAAALADLLVLLAECDARLQAPPERLAPRYERALQLVPGSRKARAALAQLCQDSGRLVDAAQHTLALAEQTPDPVERGRALVSAGMLFHEAAGTAPEGGEETTASASAMQWRSAAFEAIRAGLELIADIAEPALDRRQLEAAFWTAAPRHAGIALACLDRLLLHPDLRADKRAALLLEGTRVALARKQPGDPERALAYARAAMENAPDAAAPVHATFDALAAADRMHEVEGLVLGFFNRLGARGKDPEAPDHGDRQRLLVRLAETQESHPELAIRLLERAAGLDPQGLGLDARRKLARLYGAAGVEGPQVRSNIEALLQLDPLDEGCLAALARHSAEIGERDRTHAIYQLLRLVSPGHPEAAAFLGAHDLLSVRAGKLDAAAVTEPAPALAGVVQAMTALWEGAPELLAEELPRPKFSEAAWIEAETDRDTLLWKVWTELATQVPAQGVRLADAALIPDAFVEDGWVDVVCAHPPVVLVGDHARSADTAPRLRFALGRALFFTRPASLLVAGLPRPVFAAVLAATLQAFHPRHARRLRPREEVDLAARLGQLLARKLPIRLARQLSALFKEREHEPFDSRDWRAWTQRSGNRVGLCLARNLGAALDILGLPQEPGERVQALRARAAHDSELRDLLVFAASPAYVAARRALGFELKAR